MSELYDRLGSFPFSGTQTKGPLPIEWDLNIPSACLGIVLIAHGTGSSRFSPRNQFVARLFRENHLGTVLADLVTPEERDAFASDLARRPDLPLMASRILAATDRLRTDFLTAPIGYMGSGAGAAAVFMAAAEYPQRIGAIVSRGGRVELARDTLGKIESPTLLIVGARDTGVAKHNWDAIDRLKTPHKRLEIIPGADHVFTEPGALAAVAMLAANWFVKHLAEPTAPANAPGTLPSKAVVRVQT